MSIKLHIVTAVLGLVLGSGAMAHDGSKVPAVEKTYSAAEIEAMNMEQLQALYTEMETLFQHMKKRFNVGADSKERHAIIDRWKRFECVDAVYSLLQAMNAELQSGSDDMALLNLQAILDIFAATLTANPPKIVEELTNMREIAFRKLSTVGGEELIAYFDYVLDKAKSRPEELVHVRGRIESLKNAPDQVRRKLELMEKTLKSRIRGQPEVVEALMAMEWSNNLFKNSRQFPDFIYMMGLPGTGKDTAAEAFTDALWEKEGAHEEHMFRVPVMRSKSDMWQVLGSSTGYVGSGDFPPLLDFLVKHSGGRYLLHNNNAGTEKPPDYVIVENKEWKGENLPGYATPDQAVVFCNEFHNWSKDIKDLVIKQALEKGYFTVNNPKGGVAQIYVPVRFVFASNEGIGLVTAREANGQRFGKPLNYEQMLAKWEGIHGKKDALRNEILSRNGGVNGGASPGGAGQEGGGTGTSEEVLNRLTPDRYLLLMRPLSPETLQEIAKDKLNELKNKLSKESGFFASVDLKWDEKILELVQNYDFMAEENARPIKGNIETLIKETLLGAVRDGDIPLAVEKKKVSMGLSYKKNDDNTMTLLISYKEERQAEKKIEKLIAKTEKDRPRPALTDEQIKKLLNLANNLKKRVFGIDLIADRIADRILAIENQRTAETEESRRVATIVALGLTSTGKTELAKAITAEVTGDDKNLVTFDFSQIQTLEDFKDRILGKRNHLGEPIKSDFMKAYDRNNGRVVVAFDELANVRNPELLTALYDFFRESVMTTFSDGKPRKMGGVLCIVTGNAGQELYKNVPQDVPMDQQMVAWEEISKKIANNPGMQREILERYFPAPLVTRWGKNNTFFFPPHTFKSLRQLSQFKLEKELNRLRDTKSRRGWNVVVATSQEYSRLVDAIVEEGFSLRYQGASIDSFILEDLGEALEATLLKNLVPSGSTVVVQYVNKTPNDKEDHPGFVNFKVYVEGRNEALDFAFRRPHVEKPMEVTEESQKITAFHEAGHSLVRQVLLSKETKPGLVSIIPGVAYIGKEWISYAGIAQHEIPIAPHYDRTYVLKVIAEFAAGEVAEGLVTIGERHTAGKSNDMERASRYAQDAILRYGLSDAWGTRAIPQGMSVGDYMNSLSEKDKLLLQVETQKLVVEGRELARQVILANWDNGFLPLGNLLAEKGIIEADEMEKFYAGITLNYEWKEKSPSIMQRLRSLLPARKVKVKAKDTDLIRPEIETVDKVANIKDIVAAKKQKQFNEVPLPEKLPVGTNAAYDSLHTQQVKTVTCDGLFGKKAG